MAKIALIDDDENLHDVLEKAATRLGYEFCGALESESGFQLLETMKPDILLLDVMMPGLNGFDFCRIMRERGRRIPVIFLSAKGDIVDKSTGFKAGGDDYVVKPFNMEELFLRIEANLRRHNDDLQFSKCLGREGSAEIGELRILFSQYEVYLRGKPVDLTAKEFETLALLAANPGKVFTREQIYEHIWGEEKLGNLDSVTVFIRKIREKIEDNPSKPKYILTVWRVGYKFAERL